MHGELSFQNWTTWLWLCVRHNSKRILKGACTHHVGAIPRLGSPCASARVEPLVRWPRQTKTPIEVEHSASESRSRTPWGKKFSPRIYIKYTSITGWMRTDLALL